MKLDEVMREKPNDQIRTALQYLSSHPEYYSYSRDVLNMLHGWFKHDPEIAGYIQKIMDNTKAKDMKAMGF